MAISDYKRLTVDLLAASVGYSIATVIPEPVGSSEFYVYAGLEEPDALDGIWFKTSDEFDMEKVQVKMFEIQNNLTWSLGANMPTGSYRFAGASVGTKVYMCGGGGGAQTRIYDTTTGIWTTGVNMPNNDYGITGASVGTKVYICGGDQTATRIYETTTGAWATGNNIPTNGRYMAGASVGTKVYMCGGDSSQVATRIYDTTTGVWTTGNNAPNRNSYQSAGSSVGNKVYVCGGGNNLTSLLIYDTITNTWTIGNSMPLGGFELGSASVENKVYVCGGNNSSVQTRIYDTTTGVWTTGNQMPNIDNALAGASVGTKVYMCGGIQTSNRAVTRILTTDDSVDYEEKTVVLVVGYLTNTSSNSILTNQKVIKLNNNIRIHIADGWIVKNGNLNSYETYWGDGVTWNLLKNI